MKIDDASQLDRLEKHYEELNRELDRLREECEKRLMSMLSDEEAYVEKLMEDGMTPQQAQLRLKDMWQWR